MVDIVRCPHSRYDTVLIDNYPMCKGCIEYVLLVWLVSGQFDVQFDSMAAEPYSVARRLLYEDAVDDAVRRLAMMLPISTRLDDTMRAYAESLSSVHT